MDTVIAADLSAGARSIFSDRTTADTGVMTIDFLDVSFDQATDELLMMNPPPQMLITLAPETGQRVVISRQVRI